MRDQIDPLSRFRVKQCTLLGKQKLKYAECIDVCVLVKITLINSHHLGDD